MDPTGNMAIRGMGSADAWDAFNDRMDNLLAVGDQVAANHGCAMTDSTGDCFAEGSRVEVPGTGKGVYDSLDAAAKAAS